MNVLFYLMTLLAVNAADSNPTAPTATMLTETITWDGEAGDNLWYSPANWSGDTIPGWDSDIIIPLEDTVLLISGVTTIIESVILQNGAYLYIGINDTLMTTGGGGTGSDAVRLEGTPDSLTTLKVSGVLSISNANGDGIDLNEYCYVHNTNVGRIGIFNSGGDGMEIGSSLKNDGIIVINTSGGKGINGSGAIVDAGSTITNIGSLSISNSTDNGIRLIGDLDMVNEGTLVLFANTDDAFTSTAGKFTNNGTLLASGRIKTEHFIHGNGGIVSVYDTNEPLEFSQGLNFSTNTLIYDIDGPAIGQYDQVYVTSGGIDMDTTTLVLQGAYVPVPGDIFMIIENDIGGPLGNLEFFVGLPEGSTVNFNGVDLYVTYNAGDENDVALVADSMVLVDNDNDGSPFIFDCDDNNPNISPGEPEIPNNAVDENCDGIALMIDVDMDTYNSDVDCDDNNPAVNPGATEICDGIDNNCDGMIDEGLTFVIYYADTDGDGFGDLNTTLDTCTITAPMGYVSNSTDCDDTNNMLNPSITETCDGIDNNCDGQTDEGFTQVTYYQDLDGDTYGNANDSITTCGTPPMDYVLDNTDCDDFEFNINNSITEICDGIDNNCDGQIDEGFTLFAYFQDNDGDDFGDDSQMIISCESVTPVGYSDSGGDCNDNNNIIYPGAPELCDGLDNNCNIDADEGLTFTVYYIDADNDGYGSLDLTISSCSATPDPGYAATFDDCDDGNSDINPGAMEICDNIDNNCDGQTDEGMLQSTYFADTDNDGFGDMDAAFDTCSMTAPIGYVSNSTDCDDTNIDINPDAIEILGNMVDENCDGSADPFADLDNDTYTSDVDCDDNNPDVNPGAAEVCDGIDNNCDGFIDENLATITVYVDMDNDGFGDASTAFDTCWAVIPVGYASNGDDCNDVNPDVNPDATEIANNGIDDNCDGVDLIDADMDGVGSLEDCDDNDATVYPGAPELCDGIDNSCEGEVDEGLTLTTYYEDADDDGFGNIDEAIETCDATAPGGYSSNSEDCDDTDGDINPFATEIPDNGIDEDCTGGDLVGLELVDALLVKVAPNPTSGFVQVESDQFTAAKITLMDVLGRVVLEEQFDGNSNLDISNQAAGVYWLNIEDAKRIYQMKLVKE
ncbi:MAG: hypothetical protein ACI9CQ_000078 [Saprospiraceae bacterium]|jgi:hypothetical protein